MAAPGPKELTVFDRLRGEVATPPPATPTVFDRLREHEAGTVFDRVRGAKEPESPLWLKVLRVPTKPGDAWQAYLRRLADEGKAGTPPGEALKRALKTGFEFGIDLNKDVPPTAIRSLFGVKAGQSSRLGYNMATLADYLESLATDPMNFLAPPVGKALAPVTRPVKQALGRAGAKAAERFVGTKAAEVAYHALKVGPVRAMMRELPRQYEDALVKRLDQAGRITREMNAWMIGKMKQDPYFRGVVEGYRKGQWPNLQGGRGTEPLTDLVSEYVRRAKGKGYNPARPVTLDTLDQQILTHEALRRGIPFDTVKEFGDRIIAHGDETIRHLEATGAVPFRRARGLSSKAVIPTSAANPPAALVTAMNRDLLQRASTRPRLLRAATAYAMQQAAQRAQGKPAGAPNLLAHLVAEYGKHAPTPGSVTKGWTPQARAAVQSLLAGTGIPESVVASYARQARKYTQATLRLTKQGAAQVAEDRLREGFFRRYTNQLLARPPKTTLTQLGGTAFTGGGLEEVRRAGVRGLVQSLQAEGRWLKEVPVGSAGPPGWVALPHTTKETGFLARGDKNGKLIARLYAPPALGKYLLGEIAQTAKLTTKAAREIGLPANRGHAAFAWVLEQAGKATGFWKQGKLASVPGALKDTVGTGLITEMVMRRHGLEPLTAFGTLGQDWQIAKNFAKTGRWVGDAQELYQLSPRVLSETKASTAVLKAGAQRGTEEALHTKILPGGIAMAPLKTMAGRAWGYGADLRGMMEQAYKISLFRQLKAKLGPEEAAKVVERNLLDYSDRSTALQMADQAGLFVFNAFPVGMLRLAAETMVSRPDLVLRYPRLSRLMRQEMQTPPEIEANVPGYHQGYATVPGSRSEPIFYNLGGYNPLESSQGFLPHAGSGTRPPVELSERLRELAQHTAYTPLLKQLFGEQLYSDPERPVPLEPKGSTPPQGLRARGVELTRDLAPAWARDVERVAAAARGQAGKPGKWIEDPNLRAEALAAVAGVRPIRAEGFSERKERLAGVVNRRAAVWTDFFKAMEVASGRQPAGTLADPEQHAYLAKLARDPRMKDDRYARDWAKVTDIGKLKQEKTDAMTFLKGLWSSAINDQNQITDPGALIDGYLRWKALVDRLTVLGKQETAGQR